MWPLNLVTWMPIIIHDFMPVPGEFEFTIGPQNVVRQKNVSRVGFSIPVNWVSITYVSIPVDYGVNVCVTHDNARQRTLQEHSDKKVNET